MNSKGWRLLYNIAIHSPTSRRSLLPTYSHYCNLPCFVPHRMSSSSPKPLYLKDIVKIFEEYAPLELAGSWDNVGLLVDLAVHQPIKHILLTIDLTEQVLEEAIRDGANLIVSYHPPIFSALTRLVLADVKQRIVIRAIHHNIAIYSPHTSWDAVAGGINDWLASGLGTGKVSVIQPHKVSIGAAYKVEVSVPDQHAAELKAELESIGCEPVHCRAHDGCGGEGCRHNASRLVMSVSSKLLPSILQTIQNNHPVCDPSWEVHALERVPSSDSGQGRLVSLDSPCSVRELIGRIKSHLHLRQLRVAFPASSSSSGSSSSPSSADPDTRLVRTIAICAGAGASVVSSVRADVWWTGEMSHHEVLAGVAQGTCVVLCEHSNTERGFLASFKNTLENRVAAAGGAAQVRISERDADPISLV